MSISQERVDELIAKYVNGDLTREERMELNVWVEELPVTRKLLLNKFTDKEWVALQLQKMERPDEEAAWQKLIKKYPLQANVVPLKNNAWKYMAAAAVIAAVAISAVYFWYGRKAEPAVARTNEQTTPRFKNDILPANNAATLTLADGTVIRLDSATNNGVINAQQGVSINKKDQELIYEGQHEKAGNAAVAANNTLSTGKGRAFQLQLPDGSHVWLNAESSITYPIAFTGKERNVQLTGEGYFEIAKDKSKPFHVTVNGATVEVLGTHFNVNAYSNESGVKTTLLEGSVKVLRQAQDDKQESVVIKPGQQAQLTNGSLKVSDNEDLEQVMAWKNGRFSFKNAGINDIMKQVERWYDIDIVYEGQVNDHFVGDISRNIPISKLLELLQLTDRVHFKIDGKKVTVTP